MDKNHVTIFATNLVMGAMSTTEMLKIFETIQHNIIGLLQITIGAMGVYYTYKNNQKNKKNKQNN